MQKKQTVRTLSLRGFRGMDPAGSHVDASIPRDVINFRIGENGCLIKREGFRRINSLHVKPRAFYSGPKRAYFLVGDELYALYHHNLELQYLGRIQTSSGSAFFLPHGSSMYMADRQGVYLILENEVIPIQGYAPLIAYEWPDTKVGEPYEDRNALSTRARLTYRIVSETSIFLYAGDEVESVDEVFVNGVPVAPDRFYLDKNFGTINVLDIDPGDLVLVVLTFKKNPERQEEIAERFLSSSNGICLPCRNSLRFFCWQEDDPTCTVTFTEYVPTESRLASAKHQLYGNDLYLRPSGSFGVGTQDYSITAALIQRGDLMLFTEEDAWKISADFSNLTETPTRCIHTAVGAKNRFCAALAGNDPVTFDGISVWLWGEEDEGGARRVERISTPIDDMIANEKGEYGLFYNRFTDELLLYNRTTGTVFVRNMRDGHWTRFSDIPAEEFFEGSDALCFYTAAGDICLFDPSLSVDLPDGEHPRTIVSTYVSGALETMEGEKQSLVSCRISADLHGAPLTLRLRDEDHQLCQGELREQDNRRHVLYRRLRSPRFHKGELTITSEGILPTVIHRLELSFL